MSLALSTGRWTILSGRNTTRAKSRCAVNSLPRYMENNVCPRSLLVQPGRQKRCCLATLVWAFWILNMNKNWPQRSRSFWSPNFPFNVCCFLICTLSTFLLIACPTEGRKCSECHLPTVPCLLFSHLNSYYIHKGTHLIIENKKEKRPHTGQLVLKFSNEQKPGGGMRVYRSEVGLNIVVSIPSNQQLSQEAGYST